MEEMLKELKKEKIDSDSSIVLSCIDPRIQSENTVIIANTTFAPGEVLEMFSGW